MDRYIRFTKGASEVLDEFSDDDAGSALIAVLGYVFEDKPITRLSSPGARLCAKRLLHEVWSANPFGPERPSEEEMAELF